MNDEIHNQVGSRKTEGSWSSKGRSVCTLQEHRLCETKMWEWELPEVEIKGPRARKDGEISPNESKIWRRSNNKIVSRQKEMSWSSKGWGRSTQQEHKVGQKKRSEAGIKEEVGKWSKKDGEWNMLSTKVKAQLKAAEEDWRKAEEEAKKLMLEDTVGDETDDTSWKTKEETLQLEKAENQLEWIGSRVEGKKNLEKIKKRSSDQEVQGRLKGGMIKKKEQSHRHDIDDPMSSHLDGNRANGPEKSAWESEVEIKAALWSIEGLGRRNALKNLGNTCYLNALLQCLIRCKSLVTTLNKGSKNKRIDGWVTSLLRAEFEEMSKKSKNNPHSPTKLYEEIMGWDECIHWKENEQQDARELLSFVIGKLEKENKDASKLFEGDQRSLITCKQCQKTNTNDEKSIIIALDMDSEETKSMLENKSKIKKKEAKKTIEDLLEKFNEKEELKKTNNVWCGKCGERQNAEKNMEQLWGPKILVIQLKRFLYNEERELGTIPRVSKNKQKISFEKELKIKCNTCQDLISEEQSYELKGVIEHTGKSTSEGHYIAYTREEDCWIEWNDEISRIVACEEVKKKQAYLFFWERKDDGPNNNGGSKDDKNEVAFRERVMENKVDEKKWKSKLIKEIEQTAKREEDGVLKMDVEQSNKRRREKDENMMGEEKSRRKETRVDKRQKVQVHSEEPQGQNGTMTNKSEKSLKKKDYTEIEIEELIEVGKSLDDTAEFEFRRQVVEKQTRDPDVGTNISTAAEMEMKIEENSYEGRKKRRKKTDTGKEVEEVSQRSQEERQLREIVGTLQREVEALTGKVEILTGENRELKARVQALGTKMRIRDEDEEEYMDWEDPRIREVEGSSTPVCQSPRQAEKSNREEHNRRENTSQRWKTDEKYRREALKKKRVEHEDSSLEGQKVNVNNERRRKDQRKSDEEERINKINIDVESKEENWRRKPQKRETEVRKEKKNEVPHKSFLEDCYRKQIGHSIEKPQNIDIYSYTNRRVAKGYQQVVTTCQGMYYEMTKEQVEWRQFKDTRLTIGGDRCWRAEGVTVYQPTREVRERTILAHRFALNPTCKTPRKILRKDRYYIHVYQTKIGSERRTLRSKVIARELWRRFGRMYWPRQMDKWWGEPRTIDNRSKAKEQEKRQGGVTKKPQVWDSSRRVLRQRGATTISLKNGTSRNNEGINRERWKQRNPWRQSKSEQQRKNGKFDFSDKENGEGKLIDIIIQLQKLNIMGGIVQRGRNM